VTNVKATIAGLTLAALLSACAAPPMGPTVSVMPAPGKPFDVFSQEQSYCKNYAQGQVAGAVNQANNQAVGTAAVGTALGAGLGAAVGGGRGAGVGAASGAVLGTSVAADNAAAAQGTIQQQYDNAYSQCMYSKGNQVEGYAPPASALPPPPMAVIPTGPHYDPGLVAAIQTELSRIGLLSGRADGAYGPKTHGAIVDYEKMRGLPRDGIPSPGLLDDLRRN
jgi:uncharacterized protein YcfJ